MIDMLQVHTSYFSKAVKNFNPEMQYIVVSNSMPKWWPENLPVIWLKDFAPEWHYVQRYKNDKMLWDDFAAQYKQTLLNRFGTLVKAQAYLLNMIYLAGKANTSPENIVLLCWEKEHERCHRTLLAQYLFELVYNGEL